MTFGSTNRPPRRLLLAGGGHAHLEVLRRLARGPLAGVEVTLVSPARLQPYTGMLTGHLAGELALGDVLLPLEALARAAGARFIAGRLARIVPEERTAELEEGTRLGYDLLSIDVGSAVVPPPLPPGPGVFPVRPLESLLELARALDAAPAGLRVVVVGGGPSGVELALAADARLRRRGLAFRMRLLEARDRLLPDAPPSVAALAGAILEAREIQVRTGSAVTSATAGLARDAQGRDEPFDLLVWAAGPAPAPLNARSGLELDSEGWLLVERSLRAVGREDVFAAGDAVTLRDGPRLPKAGVHAVRQGPVLWRSLRAALAGRAPGAYRPRRSTLWILNAGDGTGLLVWGPLQSHSRWARRLKERIDRRFIRRYRESLR